MGARTELDAAVLVVDVVPSRGRLRYSLHLTQAPKCRTGFIASSTRTSRVARTIRAGLRGGLCLGAAWLGM